MTSDPGERKKYWERRLGRPVILKIIKSGLTYEEAQTLETREARKCGDHCEQEPGGQKNAGNVYTVYRID